MLRKIFRVIATIYALLFTLLTILSLYDANKRGRSLDEPLLTIFVVALPGLIFIFLKYWPSLFKASLRNYLKQFAKYGDDELASMSASELQKRRDLFRLDQANDYRSTSAADLDQAIRNAKSARSSKPGAIDSFADGFKSAQEGSKGFYGTYGKQMVCVNCGQRMSKHFGLWSTSYECQQAGRKCVPYETPTV